MSAPIGAGLFASERFSDSKTRVYGLLCGLAPVDTSAAADKIEKPKKIFNFERFELITHSLQCPWEILRDAGLFENLMSGERGHRERDFRSPVSSATGYQWI